MDEGRRRRFQNGRRKYGGEGKRRLIVTEKRMESARQGGVGLQWKGKRRQKGCLPYSYIPPQVKIMHCTSTYFKGYYS